MTTGIWMNAVVRDTRHDAGEPYGFKRLLKRVVFILNVIRSGRLRVVIKVVAVQHNRNLPAVRAASAWRTPGSPMSPSNSLRVRGRVPSMLISFIPHRDTHPLREGSLGDLVNHDVPLPQTLPGASEAVVTLAEGEFELDVADGSDEVCVIPLLHRLGDVLHHRLPPVEERGDGVGLLVPLHQRNIARRALRRLRG